jgi:hypothetical protein
MPCKNPLPLHGASPTRSAPLRTTQRSSSDESHSHTFTTDYAQLLAIALDDTHIHRADFNALWQAYTHTQRRDPRRSGAPDAEPAETIDAEKPIGGGYLRAPLHSIGCSPAMRTACKAMPSSK